MVHFTSILNMSSHNESEVESLLMSPCWNQNGNGSDNYLLDGHKLLLDNDLDSLPSDSETQKNSLDVLDSLLNSSSISTSNTNLAELKPLPPFTGFSGHLSINGISGHHYHAIAQRLPEENNNNNTSNNNNSFSQNSYSQNANSSDHIVSSSTCLPDSVLMEADTPLSDVKLFNENSIDAKLYSAADSCVMNAGPDSVSSKILIDSKDLAEYDMSSIDDIAAIIGSAIADTTVTTKVETEESDTRDSWMDLDAWIEGTCVPQDTKLIVSNQDSLSEFILPHSPINSSSGGSTLQSLLTHGYMPLLQNRLQNGPPIKVEAPSSTSYCGELISTSTSPPGSVCSTTDNLIINGRFLQPNHYQLTLNSIKAEGLCSPDLFMNYPHTTSSSTSSASSNMKNKRPRTHKKSQQQQHSTNSQITMAQAQSATVNYQTSSDLNGLLGKEKPVHRCNICNRGFLNKSNIKVHLRTHTGEKPFRCEVCSKAFRQKAHLIKHQQIHKRIGRD